MSFSNEGKNMKQNMRNPDKPPRSAHWLLKRTIHPDMRRSTLWDFEEAFALRAEESTRRSASLWYWYQTIKSIPLFIINSIYWGFIMLLNYLRLFFRNFVRHKAFSFINIAGLSVGLAAGFVILNYVLHETGYDKYHEKGDMIYRVVTYNKNFEVFSALAPFIMAPTMADEFPEVEFFARTSRLPFSKIKRDQSWDVIWHIQSVDPALFSILTIDFISGDPETALADPSSVVLSEKMADKYFPGGNALGGSITVQNRTGIHDLTVTGIFRDLPEQSTFRADCITSIEHGKKYRESFFRGAPINPIKGWTFPSFNSYILLKPNTDVNKTKQKLVDFSKKHSHPQVPFSFQLQPLRDMYLRSAHFQNYPFPQGNLDHIRLFSFVAILILFMSAVNFTLLSTARSFMRTREVGMRKVLGARRADLIGQALLESVVTAFIALPAALILARLFLPALNSYLGKDLTLDYIGNATLGVLFIGVTLMLGLLSGASTSLTLSRLQPVYILRAQAGKGRFRPISRRILTIFQLIITISLISATLTVYRQVRYATNKDLGFNMENVIVIDVMRVRDEFVSHYPSLKSELKHHPGIIDVSAANIIPPSDSRMYSKIPRIDDPEKTVEIEGVGVDYGFFETLDIPLLQGRNFSEDYGADDETSAILNETAVKSLGITDPLNATLPGNMKIIGVVKDFYFHSLRYQIYPTSFNLTDKYLGRIIIKLEQDNINEAIDFIRDKWSTFMPNEPFAYRFLDEQLHELYEEEKNFGRAMRRFTLVAVVLACLGLLGLSIFIAQRRLKEVSIRKVFGASVPDIIRLLSREFILLVGISTLLSVPFVLHGMNRWLRDFVNHIRIDAWIFILAGFLALILSWAAVSIQIIKAALTNPVEVLSYE